MDDPNSPFLPPMLPPGMEGMVPPPPPPRNHVGNYPPPPPYKPAGFPIPHQEHVSDGYPGIVLEEYSPHQSGQEYEDPIALPTSFGAPKRGNKPYGQQEQQHVQPEYNVHPKLRKPDDAAYRPYKRKASSPTHPSSSSFDPPSFPSHAEDDDIKPNLSLYQQTKPEPYVSSQASSAKRMIPSREEESVGTYNYKKSNPFEQASALQGGARPKDSSAGAGGRGGEVRGADGVVGVAPYKRRTFTVEESRAKQKQQQESAVNITNSVVASIREKLASGGRISKGQVKILNRDQDIISTIAMPTYVAHRTGSGLTPEQIQKAQEEHTRKLLGWKYHVAVKARNEQVLETKRQKK